MSALPLPGPDAEPCEAPCCLVLVPVVAAPAVARHFVCACERLSCMDPCRSMQCPCPPSSASTAPPQPGARPVRSVPMGLPGQRHCASRPPSPHATDRSRPQSHSAPEPTCSVSPPRRGLHAARERRRTKLRPAASPPRLDHLGLSLALPPTPSGATSTLAAPHADPRQHHRRRAALMAGGWPPLPVLYFEEEEKVRKVNRS